MTLTTYNRIFSVAVVLFLILSPVAWAQVQEQAPLSLSGNLGVGFSDVQDNRFSHSGPITSGDTDLSGYWRDPRILLFDFSPYATFGNSFANGIELGNRGKGFQSSMTFLGGSIVPVTVSYSRTWQDIPNFSNNPLSALSTSLSNNTLSVDTGVYWGKIPPISIHYGIGGSDTDYSSGIGTSHTSFNSFGASTYHSMLGWRLTGAYTQNHTDATRVNLENLAGPLQAAITDTRDVHLEAQSLSRIVPLTLVGGERKWKDDAPGFQNTDTNYYYAHLLGNVRPFNRLNVNFNAGYDSNDTAYLSQQVLGQQGSGTGQTIILPGSNSSSTTYAGVGAQFILPKGFSVNGNESINKLSGANGLSGHSLIWDAALNYLRRLGRSGSLTAAYGYQHSETEGLNINGTSEAKTLRVGASSMVPYDIFLSGNMHYDQRNLDSVSLALGHVNSPGRNYGFTLGGGRQVNNRFKLNADFDYSKGQTDYPVFFETNTKSFGIRADSGAWQLSLHRSYQQGLAMQVGNGLVFVNNPQQALLTPLVSVLSSNKNVQNILTGVYQPARKRFKVSGSWIRFAFENRGAQATDANIYNFVVSYRLRLLRLQMGYYMSSSQAFAIKNSSPLERRQIYFQVIRHFNFF